MGVHFSSWLWLGLLPVLLLAGALGALWLRAFVAFWRDGRVAR